MAKKDNSDALQLSAVFGTRQHFDYRITFWRKTF